MDPHAPLDGIGGGAKLQLRFAVQLLRLQHIAKRKRLFALHLILGGALVDLAERDSAAAMIERLVRNLPLIWT
ncbi:MAG: hypothetical protein E6Q29_09595 [Alicycliphilus sp.]|nr:MAG: hypothetical protein E6Q29_09595 [Alicycliphilus sp.]